MRPFSWLAPRACPSSRARQPARGRPAGAPCGDAAQTPRSQPERNVPQPKGWQPFHSVLERYCPQPARVLKAVTFEIRTLRGSTFRLKAVTFVSPPIHALRAPPALDMPPAPARAYTPLAPCSSCSSRLGHASRHRAGLHPLAPCSSRPSSLGHASRSRAGRGALAACVLGRRGGSTLVRWPSPHTHLPPRPSRPGARSPLSE